MEQNALVRMVRQRGAGTERHTIEGGWIFLLYGLPSLLCCYFPIRASFLRVLLLHVDPGVGGLDGIVDVVVRHICFLPCLLSFVGKWR